MSYLITGSGGFIGINLKEYFAGKYNLLTPRSYELDLTNRESVRKYFKNNDIEFIVHCSNRGGIRGIEDDDSVDTDNMLMVDNLINAKDDETKMIVFGSGAQYDKTRSLHKVSENELFHSIPKDRYGKSKLEMAHIANNRDDIVCLTLFGCYGKHEKETRFPTYAIKQNIKSEPIIINQNAVFDYLYIHDLSKIIEHFIHHFPNNKVINVTPSESISMIIIAEIVNELSNKKSEIIIKNSICGNEYTGDNTLLLREIPNFSFTDYKYGLSKLMTYLNKM